MNFQLFLAASKISDEEFLALGAVDKSMIYANFSKTETGKQALPMASMPTLTLSDAKLDTEVKAEEDDKELDQCYHRLIHSHIYLEALEKLKVYKQTRGRCHFPDKKLPMLEADVATILTTETRLWLRRLYYWAVVPPDSSIEDDENVDSLREAVVQGCDLKEAMPTVWTSELLFLNVFQLQAITDLNSFMQSNDASLSASTFIKGYNCLLFILKAIFGKHLSSCSSESQRLAVEQIRSKLRDVVVSWSGQANLSGNQVEKKRIQFALVNIPATDRLKMLYTLFFTELYWFRHSYGTASSCVNLSRAVGFVVCAFILGRPAGRPQFIELVTMADVRDCKAIDPSLRLVFDRHKNARRTKLPNCSVAFYPSFVVRILNVYLTRLRPNLLSDGWIGDETMLFPANALTLVVKFFRSLGLDLSAGSARQLFCQAIAEVNVTTRCKWSNNERRDLQMCAGHAGNTMIEKHYELTAKSDREILLQRFLQEEFFTPTRQSLSSVLLTTPKHVRMQCLRNQSQTVLDWSDEESTDESHETDPNWSLSDAICDSPTEICLPVRKKRALPQDEQVLSAQAKRLRPTLTRDLKAAVKAALIQLFRVNYLVQDCDVQTVIWAEMTNVFGASVDVKAPDSNLVFKETKKYGKGLLKNWVNTLPAKSFCLRAIASNATTVAALKTLVSASEVQTQLSLHPCFGDSIVLSVENLKRLRKDIEQRVVNFREHLALCEPVANRPDSKKHFAGLQKWRRGTLQNGVFTRFEELSILPTDTTVFLERDYKIPSDND